MADEGGESKFFMGVWDCSMCGQTNPGDALSCPACFVARPAGVIFYLPQHAAEITSAQAIEAARAGPAWRCAHCTYDNPATQVHCQHCGALRDEAEERAYELGGARQGSAWQERQAFETRIYTPAPTNPDYETRPAAAPPARAAGGQHRAGPRPRLLLWGGAAVVVGVVALLGYLATRRPPVELEVARLQWHRALEIYHPQTRSASGWSVPAGATLVTQETRQQGWTPVPDGFETVTRRVAQRVQDGTETVREPVRVQTGTQTEQYACGTRDLGNGRFETALCTREVPVYGTTTVTKQVPRYTTVEVPVQERVPKYRDVPRYADWYTYTLTECVHVDTLVAQGPDAQPHWPPGVPPLSAACPAQRSEQYPVTFRTVAAAGHQATYPQAVDLEAFTRYRMGARVRGTVNVLGVLADVTPRR